MGSSNSSSSNKNPLVEQKDIATDDMKQQQLHQEKIRKIEQKINQIKTSIQNDTGVPNLISQLSKLICLEGSNVQYFGKVVNEMGTQWKSIMDNEESLKKWVGQKEVSHLKALRMKYFKLLLETKQTVTFSLEESEIQRENIGDILTIINVAAKEGSAELTNQQQKIYKESFKDLAGWIDQSELQKLINKWNKMCRELEEKKSRLSKLCAKYKKQKIWAKIAIGLGIVIALGAIIALVIATSGVGAAIAAPAAKTVTVLGTKFVTAHLVAAGIGVGTSLLVVSAAGGYVHYKGKEIQTMQENIMHITSLLQSYFNKGVMLQTQLNNVQGDETKIKARLKHLDNPEAIKKIRTALNKIDGYLEEYQTHGNKVISTVDDAMKEFIQ
eukprot:17899_1